MTRKSSLFTIRKKRKERHPQVIVGVSRTTFDSIGLTHSPNDGNKTNILLKTNPNKVDKRNAYVKKRIIRDFKFKFSKAFNNYKLSDEDIDELIKYFSSKKKRK